MPFTQMTSENYHCLDINYKTEMELKTINTYFFMLFVLISFFFFHLTNFKNIEIRRLYSELDTIKRAIKGGESEESESGDGSSDESGDGSESEGESSGLVQTIKFRGKNYVMS